METKDQMIKKKKKTAGIWIVVIALNIRPDALSVTPMIEPYKIINNRKQNYQ